MFTFSTIMHWRILRLKREIMIRDGSISYTQISSLALINLIILKQVCESSSRSWRDEKYKIFDGQFDTQKSVQASVTSTWHFKIIDSR